MKTYTGRQVDPLNLKESDIDIVDIAHHLSHSGRFNGATAWYYSNAQHSVYVAQACSPQYMMHGLLHDATDAYLPDVPTPIKYSEGFGFERFREIETAALKTIYRRFGLDPEMPPEVKVADNAVKASEGIWLMNHRFTFAEPLDGLGIAEWSPELAKEHFLDLYRRLISGPLFTGKT